MQRFAFHAAKEWNELDIQLRNAPSLNVFKRTLSMVLNLSHTFYRIVYVLYIFYIELVFKHLNFTTFLDILNYVIVRMFATL